MAKKRALALITAILVMLAGVPAYAAGELSLPTGVQAMGATGVDPSDYDKLVAFLTDYFEYKDPDLAADGKNAADGAAALHAEIAADTAMPLVANGIDAADFTTLYNILAGADTSGGQAEILGDLITLASTDWSTPRDNLMASAAFVDDAAYDSLSGSKAGAYYLYMMEALQSEKLASYDTYAQILTVDFGSLSKDTAIDKYEWDTSASFGVDAFSDFAAYLFTGTTPAQTDNLLAYLETEFSTYAALGETQKNKLKDALSGLGLVNTTSSAPSGGGGSYVLPVEEPVILDPVVTENEEGQTVVTTEVEHAAEVVISSDGTEVATLDSQTIESAIDSALYAASGQEASPVLQLDIDAESLDVSVDMHMDSAACLCENHVETIIDTGKMIYSLPSEIMSAASDIAVSEDTDASDHPEDYDIVLNSHQMEKEDLLGKIDTTTPDGKAFAEAAEGKTKLIEISMDILKSGRKIGEVHDLGGTMTIDISLEDMPGADSDKLGIYYLDEESGQPIFMSGKVVVRDGVRMIELTTDHLSKFAIMELDVTYPDVAVHWSKSYVESMGAKHVISGYPDGTFLPEKAVTRAEFAKMVVEAMEYGTAKYQGQFPDVDQNDWYSGYVAAAEAKGIIYGYDDGSFKPDTEMTRLVMSAMICRACSQELSGNADQILSIFADDEDIQAWGVNCAAKAVELGLMNGMDGSFNPDGRVTRGQAATAIYRLYNK